LAQPARISGVLRAPNRIRDPSNLGAEAFRLCQGLTSMADGALRFGATQHISVVLTASCVVSHPRGADSEAAIAVTEVAASNFKAVGAPGTGGPRLGLFYA